MIYEESGCEPVTYVESSALRYERLSLPASELYYPRFDGLTQYALLSSPLVVPAGVDFELEVAVSGLNPSAYQSIFSGSTIDNFFRSLSNGDGIQVYAGGYVVTWSTTGFNPSARHVYLLKRVGTTISILVDGEVKATRSGSTQAVEVDRLMRSWTTSSYTTGLLESFKLSIAGVLSNAIMFNQRNQNVQQASVGSVNAAIINHTEAMWELS
ncbi:MULTISPECIES: hypothetical protein [Vibrio]|uniref:hypothetical protein n=1 Tax=Vibrio TaxID=662 RepID=UPI000BA8FF2F|nr:MULTISPECIES: hypothetical protein [Vibrio]PAR52829.1 hypothetical protein CGT93_15295 [Vibrio metoecus]PAR89515.1 hypothetical protein CGT83_10380 [Vibrio cholerae]